MDRYEPEPWHVPAATPAVLPFAARLAALATVLLAATAGTGWLITARHRSHRRAGGHPAA
jgi:hypothetical protein